MYCTKFYILCIYLLLKEKVTLENSNYTNTICNNIYAKGLKFIY